MKYLMIHKKLEK